MDNKQPKPSPSIFRSSMIMAIITMLSRILGMLRDIGLVMFFGGTAWVLDAFYFAFTIPNLFRKLLGEGALTAAFLPEFVHAKEKKEDYSSLASTTFTMLFLLTIAVALLGSLCCYLLSGSSYFDPRVKLVLILLAIMLPFAVFICSSALFGAILQSFRSFAVPAAMSILLNISILGSLAYISWQFWPPEADMGFWQKVDAVPAILDKTEAFTVAVRYVAYAVVLAGILQLIVQYPLIRAKGVKLSLNLNYKNERFRSVILNMLPTALGLGLVQFNVLVDNLIAYWLSIDGFGSGNAFEGATSYLFLGNRLMQLPLGIFAIAVATASFPALSSLAARDKVEEFINTFFSSIKMMAFIIIPAAVGMIALAPESVRLLYQSQDIEFSDVAVYRTSSVLVCLCLGLFFFSLQQVIVRAFYSMRDYRTPVKIAVKMVALNFVLNIVLIKAPDLYRLYFGNIYTGMTTVPGWGGIGYAIGESGLALATSITAAINVVLLYRALSKKLVNENTHNVWSVKTNEMLATTGRTVVAAICMGVIVIKAAGSIPYGPELIFKLEKVVLPIIIAVFFYPMISAIFVPQEYELIMGKLKSRLKRK